MRHIGKLLVGVILLLSGPALAVPEFTLENTQDNGNGTWTSSYTLSNSGGDYDVYDVDFSQVGYGWIDVQTPDNWAYDYHYDGPMSRFSTDDGPCVIDKTIGGFHITAGTPVYGGVMVTYTDIDHIPFKQGLATGMVQLPLPEPATLSLLALGGLALIRRRRKA